MSDYDAWANMVTVSRYAGSSTEAAALGLNAGLDQEGGGTTIIDKIPDAVSAGLTTAKHVRRAFERLMLVRMRLGLFDPPGSVQWNRLDYHSTVMSAPHTALN